jgi:hypothetical protein
VVSKVFQFGTPHHNRDGPPSASHQYQTQLGGSVTVAKSPAIWRIMKRALNQNDPRNESRLFWKADNP